MTTEVSTEQSTKINAGKPTKYMGPSIGGFGLTLLIAAALYFAMTYLPKLNLDFLPYDIVSAQAPSNLFYQFIWFIQDFTNAQFYASVFAGLGMILGAVIAYVLSTRHSVKGGFTISYVVGIWPWVFAAQLLGLIISVFVCKYVLLLDTANMGWVPTFIPFVSIPVIVVLVYGTNWRSVLTGALLGGVTGTPIATALILYVMDPLNLPAVAANTFTMALTGIIALEVCRYLPWMKKPDPETWLQPPAPEDAPMKPNGGDTGTSTWFMRRVLADFTEAQFWGNEWASGLMLVGLLLDWFINPASTYYGSGLLPIMLACAILSSSIGVFLYHKEWTDAPFYPTFVPVVSIVPGAVLIFQGDIVMSVLAAVIGGVIGAPFAAAIGRHIPEGWHPMIGNTFSMSVCTIIVVLIIKALPIGMGLLV